VSERLYPIRPLPEADSRFTLSLAFDVADVLKDHGFPELAAGLDFVDLQQALYGFLYGDRPRTSVIEQGEKDTAQRGESTPQPAPVGDVEVALTALPPLVLTGSTFGELPPDYYGRTFFQLDGWLSPTWRSDEFAVGTAHIELARVDGRDIARGVNAQIAVSYRPEGRFMTIQWLKERTR
jgi:hypothetical protein